MELLEGHVTCNAHSSAKRIFLTTGAQWELGGGVSRLANKRRRVIRAAGPQKLRCRPREETGRKLYVAAVRRYPELSLVSVILPKGTRIRLSGQ
jgi:hypothetical protein